MKAMFRPFGFLALMGLGLFAPSTHANNISVTNVSALSANTNTGTIQIKFDLAWENSWRVAAAPANWDAAWVFAKYQLPDGIWRQCSIELNLGAHTVPGGATLTVGQTSGRGVGVFIYRSTNGSGTVSWPNCRLQWNYAYDGVRSSDLVSVDVTAIEMVYVPQGAFYAGDGVSSNRFQLGGADPTATIPITGFGPMNFNDSSGFWVNGLTNISLRGVQVPGPYGYGAFYCMKYECSQGQLASFLNKTTRTFRYPYPYTRMSFANSPPYVASSTPDRAALSFEEEVLAYLDWTGLRPMTDLEYEKACRGPTPPFGGEFAWGTALRALTRYAMTNDGSALEMVSAGYQTHFGNTWDLLTASDPAGPCRVGMFAMSTYSGSAPGRIQSGATYYGIMDMTGNVGEPVYPVVTTNNQALVYSGTHGDGNLSANMTANVTGWPTNTVVARGGGVDTTFASDGHANCGAPLGRAKSVSDRSTDLRVSGWSYHTVYPNTYYDCDIIGYRPEPFGIRGVRTAP